MGEDIEDIRKRKLRELREEQNEEDNMEELEQEEIEREKEKILKQTLTADARKRLNTVKMAKEELAEMVENSICKAVETGQIQGQINDEEMKELLKRVKEEEKQDFDIVRR